MMKECCAFVCVFHFMIFYKMQIRMEKTRTEAKKEAFVATIRYNQNEARLRIPVKKKNHEGKGGKSQKIEKKENQWKIKVREVK